MTASERIRAARIAREQARTEAEIIHDAYFNDPGDSGSVRSIPERFLGSTANEEDTCVPNVNSH